jgi:hypothetical protein
VTIVSSGDAFMKTEEEDTDDSYDEDKDRMVFNPNMNSFYRSCLQFYTTQTTDGGQGIALLRDLIARVRQAPSLAHAWGILQTAGIRTPLDLSLMEVPYLFSGEDNKRHVLPHFEESGVFYDARITSDAFLERARALYGTEFVRYALGDRPLLALRDALDV